MDVASSDVDTMVVSSSEKNMPASSLSTRSVFGERPRQFDFCPKETEDGEMKKSTYAATRTANFQPSLEATTPVS